MKLDVMRLRRIVDINALAGADDGGAIRMTRERLRLGALARMSEAAEHPEIKRNYPVLSQSLLLAASSQLRNMATLGGNLLQRTRDGYFRDTSYVSCNKRQPGSGCAALDGYNRSHAVHGASNHCIAAYPGDFAQALIALDASIEVRGQNGVRSFPFAELHKRPASTPQVETSLAQGELITAILVPAAAFSKRSLYLKIRDRESYEFALVSAAETAFAQARPRAHNAFKIALGKETLVRTLAEAAKLEA